MRCKAITVLILLVLASNASASSIVRTVEINDETVTFTGSNYTYKTATITLTPSPVDDFKLPGYLAEEYIPNGASLIETSADWYQQDGNKLAMLRFNPTQDSAKLTYKLKIPLEGGTYIFSGYFRDRYRAKGDIPQQEVKIDKAQQDTATATVSESSQGKYWGKPKEEVQSSAKLSAVDAPIAVTAAQKLPDESGDAPYLWRMVFVVLIITGYLIGKRYGKRLWNKFVVTEYVFVEQEKLL